MEVSPQCCSAPGERDSILVLRKKKKQERVCRAAALLRANELFSTARNQENKPRLC